MDMQNVSNLTIPEGKVRTIHDKDNRLLWGRVAYDVKYAGDTTQNGTPTPDTPVSINVVTGYQSITMTGKNLFDKDNYSSFAGYFTSSDTAIATGSGGRNIIIYLRCLPSTTYSFTLPPTSYSIITKVATSEVLPASGVTVSGSVRSATDSLTNYTTGATAKYLVMYLQKPSDSTSMSDLISSLVPYIQVEQNPSTTVYEPYQSDVFPIGLDIGNMAPMSDFQIGGMNSGNPSPSVKYQVNNAGHPIKVNPNTQYTISVELGGIVKGMRVGVHSCDANLTFISDSGWKQLVPTAYTFTTGANVEYVKLIFSLSTTSSTVTTGGTQDTTQYDSAIEWFRGATTKMNAGSSAIPDVELCKISTYQDYIYKSGDDWYVHKETARVDVSGLDGWFASGSYAYKTRNGVSDILPASSDSATAVGLCNAFSASTTNLVYAGSVDYGFALPGGGGVGILIRNKNVASLADFTTYLSNNPVYGYFALATPTDTKITDATLVGQLNAVHEWLTRYGYNATVNGNLPLIVNRTNL